MAQPAYLQSSAYCIAVSTSEDATGTFYRYAFSMPSIASPKLGVWPDAYYFAADGYNDPYDYSCAFDRNAMLNGQAATAQCFNDIYTDKLPADLDGPTPPPPCSPGYFMNRSYDGSALLHRWKFHVDFSNSSNSTFTGPFHVAEEALFSEPCGGDAVNCVPQL